MANKTGFNIIIFHLNIRGKLSIIRSQCFENSNIKQKLIILLILLKFKNFILIRDGNPSKFWTGIGVLQEYFGSKLSGWRLRPQISISLSH